MSLVLRLCLLLGCLMSGQAEAAPHQEELEALRDRIRSMQQEMERAAETKSEVADALRESEQAISHSNRRLGELTEQQRTTLQELLVLQKKSGQLGHDLAGQQSVLGRLLYQHYVGGQHEYLYLLLNGRDPNQISRNLHYYEYLAKDRADVLGKMRTNLAALATVTEETRQKHNEVRTLQQEEQAQKQQLEKERRAKEQVMIKIAQQLKQQRQEIEHLRQDEVRLSQLIERLRTLSKKAVKPKKESPSGGKSTAKAAEPRLADGAFFRLRGKLLKPVRGNLSNQYGTQRGEGGVSWKGWFLRAANGAPVKSVAAGQVVYADWMRGFGNLLIVDHGEGYMSLYGNNETLYKQVGDQLKGGETIATVGNSGGNETYGLYFELRHEGKPLDPGPWIAGK